ncbi:hypothetical protein PsorP6_002159 [Peronosclerospora sorghi]|uniref:Uncharacterized protein n=1 Tax=Peronosclerospora sorghi TaxID=230839 RepID=A0ACC0WVB1_9STRA|nr:hypothetical protein PsorP6_002159 [Peronosclerospora sorghi]
MSWRSPGRQDHKIRKTAVDCIHVNGFLSFESFRDLVQSEIRLWYRWNEIRMTFTSFWRVPFHITTPKYLVVDDWVAGSLSSCELEKIRIEERSSECGLWTASFCVELPLRPRAKSDPTRCHLGALTSPFANQILLFAQAICNFVDSGD